MSITVIASKTGEDFRESVSEKLKELQQESQVLGREIEERQIRQTKIAQMITHLDGILKLSGDEQKPDDKPTLRRANYKEICDLVAQILAERQKQPVHYRELADEVQRRGIELGGADPGRTLVAKLVWDSRFIRPKQKGYYALREDYPDAPNIGARKSRRNRRSNPGGSGEATDE